MVHPDRSTNIEYLSNSSPQALGSARGYYFSLTLPIFNTEDVNGMQPTGADDAAWNFTFLLVGLKLFSFLEMKM